MKIGLMHNLFGPLSRGGAEKVVQEMAESLTAAGHDVFLITTSRSGAQPADTQNPRTYFLPSLFYDLGKLAWPVRAVWHVGNVFSLSKYFKIKNLLRTEKPDLVITHNLTGLGFLTPRLLRGLRIVHHHFLHDIQLLHPSGLMLFGKERVIDTWPAKAYQAINRRLFGSPEKVIAPSHWLLNLHEAHGFFPRSATEIRPLDKPREIDKTGERTGVAERSATQSGPLLFVGQIETHKGIFLLLEAFRQISDPALRLDIVGDGQRLNEAEQLVRDDGRIRFFGRLDRQAVRERMAGSSYLIVPSLCYENSPAVIYEAHALGLPVIAADLGGIPEIVSKSDTLFAPGDAKSLRDAICARTEKK